jgi:hypothetical protein
MSPLSVEAREQLRKIGIGPEKVIRQDTLTLHEAPPNDSAWSILVGSATSPKRQSPVGRIPRGLSPGI